MHVVHGQGEAGLLVPSVAELVGMGGGEEPVRCQDRSCLGDQGNRGRTDTGGEQSGDRVRNRVVLGGDKGSGSWNGVESRLLVVEALSICVEGGRGCAAAAVRVEKTTGTVLRKSAAVDEAGQRWRDEGHFLSLTPRFLTWLGAQTGWLRRQERLGLPPS